MKKALVVLFVLMLAVCLTSCGGDAEEVGSYDLESMSEGGQTMSMKDLKDLYSAMGETLPEFGLTLNKDGTGKMAVMGETQSIKWDSKAKTITGDGETIKYTFKDNKLTIDAGDGSKMIFVKK